MRNAQMASLRNQFFEVLLRVINFQIFVFKDYFDLTYQGSISKIFIFYQKKRQELFYFVKSFYFAQNHSHFADFFAVELMVQLLKHHLCAVYSNQSILNLWRFSFQPERNRIIGPPITEIRIYQKFKYRFWIIFIQLMANKAYQRHFEAL